MIIDDKYMFISFWGIIVSFLATKIELFNMKNDLNYGNGLSIWLLGLVMIMPGLLLAIVIADNPLVETIVFMSYWFTGTIIGIIIGWISEIDSESDSDRGEKK